MIKRPGANHYEPITWEAAFVEIAAQLRGLANPNEAVFYTSGRTSNESAFLVQLMVRCFGTNNLPDCSNMCHEPTSYALGKSLGLGKGSVSLEFRDDYDAIRDRIAKVIPGFERFNQRIRIPGGFALPHPPRYERRFPTSDGLAHFNVTTIDHRQQPAGELMLQTLRSHDQYNTTVYGHDDRYRGLSGDRHIVMVNRDDLAAATATSSTSLVCFRGRSDERWVFASSPTRRHPALRRRTTRRRTCSSHSNTTVRMLKPRPQKQSRYASCKHEHELYRDASKADLLSIRIVSTRSRLGGANGGRFLDESRDHQGGDDHNESGNHGEPCHCRFKREGLLERLGLHRADETRDSQHDAEERRTGSRSGRAGQEQADADRDLDHAQGRGVGETCDADHGIRHRTLKPASGHSDETNDENDESDNAGDQHIWREARRAGGADLPLLSDGDGMRHEDRRFERRAGGNNHRPNDFVTLLILVLTKGHDQSSIIIVERRRVGSPSFSARFTMVLNDLICLQVGWVG